MLYSFLELVFVVLLEGYVRNLPAHHVLRHFQYRFRLAGAMSLLGCVQNMFVDGFVRPLGGFLGAELAGGAPVLSVSEMNRSEPDLQGRKYDRLSDGNFDH